ncbi:hypothetical protein [Rhodococcoides fascians]|uniref:hypothetical protein n=1 Tax=Rhodococcoides fascians TaxID=1828 RepID=UPI0005693BCA|nr:hypothetical protein [Rhodococcus fascians]
MRKLWLALAAFATVAGCSTKPEVEQPTTFDMNLVLDVAPQYVTRTAAGCDSDGISKGTGVTVRDGDGTTVGAGAVEAGVYYPDSRSCRFPARIQVQDGSAFYEITVRDRASMTVDEARAKAGVQLTFGY